MLEAIPEAYAELSAVRWSQLPQWFFEQAARHEPIGSHFNLLCRNWPPSLERIWFHSRARACHLLCKKLHVLLLKEWRLPARLAELRIHVHQCAEMDDKQERFYEVTHPVPLPSTMTRVDVGFGYDRDLNIQPRTEKPPARSPSEQAEAKQPGCRCKRGGCTFASCLADIGDRIRPLIGVRAGVDEQTEAPNGGLGAQEYTGLLPLGRRLQARIEFSADETDSAQSRRATKPAHVHYSLLHLIMSTHYRTREESLRRLH
jgi:hypothetical protein